MIGMLAAGLNCSRSQDSAWGGSCRREARNFFPFGKSLHKALFNKLADLSC